MDYAIYNIELVNRLSAWQHTAFKTNILLPVVQAEKEQTSASKAGVSPPIQQEPVDLLNVIAWGTADFVLCRKICCPFHYLPPRCRSPPLRLDFSKNSDEAEEPCMWQRNNGQGEANILQNQFTAFLMTAVRWQKIDYLRNRTKRETHEVPANFDHAVIQTRETGAEKTVSLEQPVLESIALAQALSQISDRERYVFFARALEGRSFDELALELGVGYKGAAAIYYRTIRKLKKEL